MALAIRLRRPPPTDLPSSSSSSPPYSRLDKPSTSSSRKEEKQLGWFLTVFALGILSSEFALRSYLYIVFHNLVGIPASWFFGEDSLISAMM
ncbi:unnamed protein product [Rhodiola kirilowii]